MCMVISSFQASTRYSSWLPGYRETVGTRQTNPLMIWRVLCWQPCMRSSGPTRIMLCKMGFFFTIVQFYCRVLSDYWTVDKKSWWRGGGGGGGGGGYGRCFKAFLHVIFLEKLKQNFGWPVLQNFGTPHIGGCFSALFFFLLLSFILSVLSSYFYKTLHAHVKEPVEGETG